MSIDKFKQKREEFLINEAITYPELRVLDEKETMLGVIKTSDALVLAKEKDLDLIVITDKATPPVARIIDYKKFLYEKEKQKKETKKKQKVVDIKEVKVKLKIGINDLNIKIRNTIKFLQNGDKVKISVSFYGREIERKEKGYEILDKVILETKDFGDVEKRSTMMGNQMLLFLSPKK